MSLQRDVQTAERRSGWRKVHSEIKYNAKAMLAVLTYGIRRDPSWTTLAKIGKNEVPP
ncbi:hypothetical protein [Ammoniphilus sp. CFH 90114]|uniref:hypothetical protein n=1 Tax=Ammoniphilus sp. CFH 90114 TaxID=2493665 RepID=UPI0013E928BA|nr:hypothetical protein [Ammoniphilus sp. CFH 90114]